MDNAIQIVSVPVIVGIVYLVLFIYKHVVSLEMVNSEKWTKVIPIIAAVLGIILGIIAFYCLPETIPADNVLMAILIGGASGLAATGVNQITKQLSKKTKGSESDAKNDETNKTE